MAHKRGTRGKAVLIFLAAVLVIGCAIGGTVAWLTAQSDPVANVFTYGDINVELTETTGNEYKILPGNDISKDPKVTVKAGSEASWLFVKIDEENWPAFLETDGTRKVKYNLSDGWIALDGETGVFYREVSAVSADTDFTVLADNKITVSGNLTKEEINGLSADAAAPKLTFTAYAVQRDSNVTTAAQAWTIANP